MMNLLKKNLALLLAAVFCLVLMACGVSNGNLDPPIVGDDWRVTGIVRDSGTITLDGEDTVVLVCVHASDSTFYYDTKDQVLFDFVDYPITLKNNAWEAFQSIDFADLNGDGNSDVTMKFNDGDSELLMVWFWDTENSQFVYQPEKSQLS
ncbi:MAG: hypothetical protein ACI4D4_04045 [Lachnospira sp.]